VHVVLPKGSRLLPMLANVGFAGLQRVDATFAAGERLELALELYLPDAAAAERLADEVDEHWRPLLENPVLVPDLKVTVDGASVRCLLSVPCAKLPSLADARKKMVELAR